jgi:cobyrinic acid a,c-diamide synthase
MRIARLVISGLSGGAGKTVLSLGLARSLARQSCMVIACKKGPDYIDAAWLARAARSPQATLDPYFTPGNALLERFISVAGNSDIALIEGNRGLFDGLDIAGSCSTAEVSRILAAPVLLVLDCTKMTRTVASLVKGCLTFEDGIRIGGVILNRTGGARHQAMTRRAVEELAGVPVLGILPRGDDALLPERHMGLAGLDESSDADACLDNLADFVAAHVDVRAIERLAASAPALPRLAAGDGPLPPAARKSFAGGAPDSAAPDARFRERLSSPRPSSLPGARRPIFGPPPLAPRIFGPRIFEKSRPRIAYVHDAAFWFYYRENLEALEQAGAALVRLSLLAGKKWPPIDGLYMGGGLPELHAEKLSGLSGLREHVASLSRQGLPIYAECGGFLFLAESLVIQGRNFPMAGVFPCTAEFCQRPQGLGYVEAEVVGENPFHPRGMRFRGHEFHFSRQTRREPAVREASSHTASGHILRLHKGRGMTCRADGLCLDGLLRGNTFAAYTHIYAPALPTWAPAFVSLCRSRKIHAEAGS